MKNKTNLFILFFISSLILAGCASYPACPTDTTCITISSEKPITIPFILPLTSQNSLLIEEQKDAIQLAFIKSQMAQDSYTLDFYDNFDLTINNQNQILTFLENPNNPAIFSSLSSNTKNEQAIDIAGYYNIEIGKPRNSSITIPGISFYINQAVFTLSEFLSGDQTIIFTSYQQFEQIKSSSICNETFVDCYPFYLFIFDELIQEKVNTAQVIVLASNQQNLAVWLKQLPTFTDQKIILFDTDFHRPLTYPDTTKMVYWLFPELWFEENNPQLEMIIQQQWKSAFSYWTYHITQPLFETIQNNISPPKSGFRHIYSNQLQEKIPDLMKPPEVIFNLYQFRDSQYIIKTNLH